MTYTIRPVTVRKEKCWCLDRTEAGKRRRSFFPTKTEAEAAAAHLRANGDDNRSAFLALEPSVREQIMAAALKALEQGHTVATIASAIETKPVPSIKQAGEALEGFLVHLKGEQRSTEYIASVRQWLGHLVRGRTTSPLSDITKDVVVSWLGERQGWTRATMRSRARAWFNWCVMEGWIKEDPTEKIPAPRIVDKPVSILTPEQHEVCLRHLEVNPRGLAWYVLSCVSGLRPGEAEQMTWENVVLDTEEPVLRVDAVTSKTGSRRAVYLDAQTVAWLKRAKALKSSLPLPWSTRRRVHRKLRELFKWAAWPQDITRHSASSYRLALHRNPHLVAEDLGHSIKTMNRHYKAVVTKEAARAFFAVMPGGTPKNTVQVDFNASGKDPTEVSGDPRSAQAAQVKEG